MVMPAFENLPIDLWGHPGRVGITQPSLCVFHHVPAVGAQLLDALDELEHEAPPAKRMLTFRPSSRKLALRNLKLEVVPVRADLKIMHIAHVRDTAKIEMTDEGLALLKEAFASWLRGAEDFGVSPEHSSLKRKEFGKLDRESGELWFWGPGYAGP